MKTLTTLLSALCFVAFFTAGAQTTANYKSQKVSDKGVWMDDKDVVLGTIDADGTLKDPNGAVYGKVTKSKTNASTYDFSDKEGRIMGTIYDNGTVKDTNGKVLYTLSPTEDANGYYKVYDASGKEIGVVHKTYKHKGVCLMHHKNSKM